MPDQVMIPDVRITVNGVPAPPDAYGSLNAVTVEEDIDALSMFTLELQNWDSETLQYTWTESSTFAVGAVVGIQLGFVDDLVTVMTGEIVSLEPVFAAGRTPTLLVRGFDARHRMARGRRTRTFVKMKDSQIVTRIAQEHGLRAVATDTKVQLEYVIQGNRSDLDFVRERAYLLGFELYVRDKILHFGPVAGESKPVATLEVGTDLTEFTPRLSVSGQVDAAVVTGWNVKQKTPFQAIAGPGQVQQMGGAALGLRQSGKAFGGAQAVVADLPIDARSRADQIALGQLTAGSLAFVQAEAEGSGRPELHAGSTVSIVGAGKVFSGPYYITALTHHLSGAALSTGLVLRRNAT
jgi:phage protein D